MTAADKPRGDLGADCSCATFGGYDSLCVIHGPKAQVGRAGYTDEDLGRLLDAPPAGERTADKPRADLVALFDAFARLPPGNATLSLFGDEHNAALCAWAAQHGHRVDREPMFTARSGRWTLLSVRVTSGTIAVHLDSVQEQPAAEGSV